MDKWLGNGGMPLIENLGAQFVRYGLTDLGCGYAEAIWIPTDLCINVHGAVQAGVHATLLDAAMNFAANTQLNKGEFTKATIEFKVDLVGPATKSSKYTVKGQVTKMTFRIAFCEAEIRDTLDNALISRSVGTFMLKRQV